MDVSNFRGRKMKSRSGIAGLFLLLILGVALMFVLFAMHMGGLNPFAPFQKKEKDRYSDPNAQPWEEGNLFINPHLDGYDMGGRQGPFPDQPKLEQTLVYKAEVYDGDAQRGEIELTVKENGDAMAIWNAEFHLEGKHYRVGFEPRSLTKSVKNRFAGNVAPLKIYEDENGQNKTKLYVIASGLYCLRELGEDERVIGSGYVTAWVSKDYSAEGKLAMSRFGWGKGSVFDWGPVEPTEE